MFAVSKLVLQLKVAAAVLMAPPLRPSPKTTLERYDNFERRHIRHDLL